MNANVGKYNYTKMRIFLLLSSLCTTTALTCGPGKYLASMGGSSSCESCSPGTFMDHLVHSEGACFSCGTAMHQIKPGQPHCVESSCDRYYTWSNTNNKCMLRHKYLKYLTTVLWSTLIANFAMRCYSDNWYAYFFIYNIIMCIGVGTATIRLGGGWISDKSFYTMTGFLSVGTLALCVNLAVILRDRVSRAKGRTSVKVQTVTELQRMSEMQEAV